MAFDTTESYVAVSKCLVIACGYYIIFKQVHSTHDCVIIMLGQLHTFMVRQNNTNYTLQCVTHKFKLLLEVCHLLGQFHTLYVLTTSYIGVCYKCRAKLLPSVRGRSVFLFTFPCVGATTMPWDSVRKAHPEAIYPIGEAHLYWGMNRLSFL